MAKPTITITSKGHALTLTIRSLGLLVKLFKGEKWKHARQFAEDPQLMSWKDLIYFGYKYYCNPPETGKINSLTASAPLSLNSTEKVTISIGGDLMPYELLTPRRTKNLWDETGDFFFCSDIVFANLETPLDLSQKPSFVPEVMLNDMLFNTDEKTYSIFSGNNKYKGYDVLSIANNHSLDMKVTGLQNTIKYLSQKNILYVGASPNSEVFEKQESIIERNGIKIGFLAYTYSLNKSSVPDDMPWLVNHLKLNGHEPDLALIKKQAADLRKKGAEILICSLHCGNAYQAFPNSNIVTLFKRVFEECNVDVIAGGHPHNIQPCGWHEWMQNGKTKKGFAIYSLADFIAWDIFTWCHLCAMLKITVCRNKDGIAVLSEVEVKPCYMQLDKAGNLRLRDFDKLISNPLPDATFSKSNLKEIDELKRFYKLIK
ncbi:MAG: CapA family protein, partial [Bacteroidia bacterium]|nr:CapA family protein [Bacteroidia bacterium]